MKFDHVSIGGGVIGMYTTLLLAKHIIKKRQNKKELNLCILDEEINNIPGGVAYSKNKSLHGFFNNPLRLSPIEFQKYIKNYKNFSLLKEFINKKGSYNDVQHIKKIHKIYKNRTSLDEVYFPRVAFAFYLEYELIQILKEIKDSNKKVKITFFEGKVENLSKVEDYYILKNYKKKFKKYRLIISNNRIKFKKLITDKEKVFGKFLTIGTGVLPPEKFINNNNLFKNYIWDYYKYGATSKLLKYLNNHLKKEIFKIGFLGSKAGFLESLIELKYLSDIEKKNFIIKCFSESNETLKPAIISLRKKVVLKFFTQTNLVSKKITAKKIYSNLLKEFKYQKDKGINNYTVWTQILTTKTLENLVNSLSSIEKKKYNNIYFQKIRSKTRYTFPEAVYTKEALLKNKKIIMVKEKVIKIKISESWVNVITNKSIHKLDLVVNVAGPMPVNRAKTHLGLVDSLNILSKNNQNLFSTDKYFALENSDNRIYLPGSMTKGFNPGRKTILSAVINNCMVSSKKIAQLLVN